MVKYTLTALFFTVLASNAIAQSSSVSWTNVSQLAPQTEIQVSLSGGRTLRGSLQSVTADALAVNTGIGQEMLPRAQIRRVQSRRRGHRGRNTLIGLGIGAGGGLAVGAALDSGNHTGWFSDFGKAFVTPLGAIVGAIVGVAIPTGGWHEIYRAP